MVCVVATRDEQNASFTKLWNNILNCKLLQHLYIACRCEQIRVLLIPIVATKKEAPQCMNTWRLCKNASTVKSIRAGRAGRTRPWGTAMGHGRCGAQKDAAIAGRTERIAGWIQADELHGWLQAGVGHGERTGGRWALLLRAGGRRTHLPSGGTSGCLIQIHVEYLARKEKLWFHEFSNTRNGEYF